MNIEQYNQLADSIKPTVPYISNSIHAFISGGIIGISGQLILDFYINILSFEYNQAVSLMSITIVLIASLLTGLGVYDKLAKKAGAGLFIPITGFANAMTSCAMDAKTEGLIFGIGSQMFKLAGSVITYGIVSSSLLGVIRYVFTNIWTFF